METPGKKSTVLAALTPKALHAIQPRVSPRSGDHPGIATTWRERRRCSTKGPLSPRVVGSITFLWNTFGVRFVSDRHPRWRLLRKLTLGWTMCNAFGVGARLLLFRPQRSPQQDNDFPSFQNQVRRYLPPRVREEDLPLLRCWIVRANHLHRFHQFIEVRTFADQQRTEMKVRHRGWAVTKIEGALAGHVAIEQTPDHRSAHLAKMLSQSVRIPVFRSAELLATVENYQIMRTRFHGAFSPQVFLRSSGLGTLPSPWDAELQPRRPLHDAGYFPQVLRSSRSKGIHPALHPRVLRVGCRGISVSEHAMAGQNPSARHCCLAHPCIFSKTYRMKANKK